MLNKGIITTESVLFHSCPSPGAPLEDRPKHTHISSSFIHSDTHHKGRGETQTPANRLPFRQDKGKHETDEEGRGASCMYLLAPAVVAC